MTVCRVRLHSKVYSDTYATEYILALEQGNALLVRKNDVIAGRRLKRPVTPREAKIRRLMSSYGMENDGIELHCWYYYEEVNTSLCPSYALYN